MGASSCRGQRPMDGPHQCRTVLHTLGAHMARQTLVGVGLLLWCGVVGPAVARAQVLRRLTARRSSPGIASSSAPPTRARRCRSAMVHWPSPPTSPDCRAIPRPTTTTAALATPQYLGLAHVSRTRRATDIEDAYVGPSRRQPRGPLRGHRPTVRGARSRAAEWLRANPHRLDLGRLGLRLDATPTARRCRSRHLARRRAGAGPVDRHVDQPLHRGRDRRATWTPPCHPDRDVLAVRVTSALVRSGRARLLVAFPYPSGTCGQGPRLDTPGGASHDVDRRRRTRHVRTCARRRRDTVQRCRWSRRATLAATAPHTFALTGTRPTHWKPRWRSRQTARPRPAACPRSRSTFAAAAARLGALLVHRRRHRPLRQHGSTVARARTPHRALAVPDRGCTCTGPLPPQETGLTANNWFGKASSTSRCTGGTRRTSRCGTAHRCSAPIARTGTRTSCRERRATARAQGYDGVRWPKMVGPDGRESPEQRRHVSWSGNSHIPSTSRVALAGRRDARRARALRADSCSRPRRSWRRSRPKARTGACTSPRR